MIYHLFLATILKHYIMYYIIFHFQSFLLRVVTHYYVLLHVVTFFREKKLFQRKNMSSVSFSKFLATCSYALLRVITCCYIFQEKKVAEKEEHVFSFIFKVFCYVQLRTITCYYVLLHCLGKKVAEKEELVFILIKIWYSLQNYILGKVPPA